MKIFRRETEQRMTRITVRQIKPAGDEPVRSLERRYELRVERSLVLGVVVKPSGFVKGLVRRSWKAFLPRLRRYFPWLPL